MQFSIPNTGYKDGTCGWLASGLSDGSITIRPGTTKGGAGGLWIKSPIGEGCLAIFNEFDLTDDLLRDCNRFDVVTLGFAGDLPLTKAASQYLREIAQQWCDAANELREEAPEKMPTFAIV